MAASGRSPPAKFSTFELIERPLSVKADIQNLATKSGELNDRFTPDSSRWADRPLNDR